MILTWPSPAKLNLFLHITGYQDDGYHQIQTLFQFLNYYDEITIEPRNDNQIQLLTSFIDLPAKNNLIVKAAHLLQQYCLKIKCNNQKGANIYVNKKLPLGSGLGGGSSNAATTLIALNYHWRTNIFDSVLAKLSVKLGADIPVFIKGHAAFAEGIGDQLLPINLAEKWYLVAYPKINISTKQIFNDPELKRNSIKQPLSKLLESPYTNDCEPIAKKHFPEIEKLFSWLLQYKTPRLTGTGSCVFVEFESKLAANNALNNIPKWARGFVAKGVNYSPLHAFRDRIFRY